MIRQADEYAGVGDGLSVQGHGAGSAARWTCGGVWRLEIMYPVQITGRI